MKVIFGRCAKTFAPSLTTSSLFSASYPLRYFSSPLSAYIKEKQTEKQASGSSLWLYKEVDGKKEREGLCSKEEEDRAGKNQECIQSGESIYFAPFKLTLTVASAVYGHSKLHTRATAH